MPIPDTPTLQVNLPALLKSTASKPVADVRKLSGKGPRLQSYGLINMKDTGAKHFSAETAFYRPQRTIPVDFQSRPNPLEYHGWSYELTVRRSVRGQMPKWEKTGFSASIAGLVLLTLVITSLHQNSQSRAAELVDLQLVLAVDVSASVDPKEFQLQKRGIYEAFLHPDVIEAIRQAGNLGIAVSVVQWSGPGEHVTAVDWVLVRDRNSAAALSDSVRAMPRYAAGMTDTAGAIRYSAARIEDGPLEGSRRVIDVSGDGPSDAASSRAERDRAVALGITINGLVIYATDMDVGELANSELHDHYAKNVVGGPGAFLMPANGYEDYRIAIRRKLIREITGAFSARLEHDPGKSSSIFKTSYFRTNSEGQDHKERFLHDLRSLETCRAS